MATDPYIARKNAERCRINNAARAREAGASIPLWSFAAGMYRVPSTSEPGIVYTVQLNGDVGVCDCIGHVSHRTNCKHIKAAIAAEREHPTQ